MLDRFCRTPGSGKRLCSSSSEMSKRCSQAANQDKKRDNCSRSPHSPSSYFSSSCSYTPPLCWCLSGSFFSVLIIWKINSSPTPSVVLPLSFIVVCYLRADREKKSWLERENTAACVSMIQHESSRWRPCPTGCFNYNNLPLSVTRDETRRRHFCQNLASSHSRSRQTWDSATSSAVQAIGEKKRWLNCSRSNCSWKGPVLFRSKQEWWIFLLRVEPTALIQVVELFKHLKRYPFLCFYLV